VCGGDRELLGALRDLVLDEHDRKRAEGVRLDDVDADLEEGPVKVPDHVRTREHEHLVAAFEGVAAEVVGAEIAKLQVRTGRAVEDDDALARNFEVGGIGGHDSASLVAPSLVPSPSR